MLLLSRPPYLSWALAVVLLAAAIAWELAGRATEPYPFAARELNRGEAIAADAVEWRELPRGSLTVPDLTGASALTDISAGDPLVSSVVGRLQPVPADWWAVPLDIPVGVPAGSVVRLSLIDGSMVDGVVTIPASEDGFGIRQSGAVAVAEQDVGLVASSAAAGEVLVLLAP